MTITKGTIVRTILILIVIVNLILQSCGVHPLNISATAVGNFVETVVQIGAIAAAWWYNNSFSKNARKADEFLKGLNESSEE